MRSILTALEPAQPQAEYEDGDDVHRIDDTDGYEFAADRLHIVHPEGDEEEVEVAKEKDEPGGGGDRGRARDSWETIPELEVEFGQDRGAED